ncbi:hypothetical protein HELRODRAFT_133869, partial [Helobdella robusta]|uniref:NYN domain-containing protein n=1 Tax=Helobdella robusta TaxID=6412 RepID=T1EI28_HELRO
PIGVFWDIENCPVPSNYSSLLFVNEIRNRFFNEHVEAEFIAVCDTEKQNKYVTVVHVCALSKNSADDKLKHSMRKFAAFHSSPSTVILISSDVNFSPEISDLRYIHKFETIVIHNEMPSKAL